MANDFFSVLKQIYGSAGLPCAIADEKLSVLWKNAAASSHRCLLSRGSLSFLFEDGAPASGTVCRAENETVHRFSVLKAEDTAGGRVFYIVEQIRSDGIKDLLTSPDIKAYMNYLCARIRESVGMIAVSADEIDSAASVFGSAAGEVTEQLNTINKGLMLILREVINPEQLYYTLDPCCNDATICLADEIEKAASDAARSLGKDVKVTLDTKSDIFARMNRGVFETIISDMAAECCESPLYPEELIFSCKRVSAGRALVSVKSVNRSGKKNTPSVFERDKKSSRLYFDYLCRVMCDKYDAEYTAAELPDGFSCSLEINTVGAEPYLSASGPKFRSNSERFCTMVLSLAEHHLEDRYKFINIDA